MGVRAISQKTFKGIISAEDMLVKNQFADIVKKPGQKSLVGQSWS